MHTTSMRGRVTLEWHQTRIRLMHAIVLLSLMLMMSTWESVPAAAREPREARHLSRREQLREVAVFQQTSLPAKIVTIQTPQLVASQTSSSDTANSLAVAPETQTSPVSVNFENNSAVRQLLTPDQVGKVWQKYSAEAPPHETWTLQEVEKEPRLVCTGKPYGYLRTRERYGDFHLKLEWRYTEESGGNSGILLFTQEEDMIWPNAIQVQLQHQRAGNVQEIGDAKVSKAAISLSSNAYRAQQWNECHISSQQGTVTVFINEVKQTEVTGCVPASGHIALQSEGSPVQFRRIQLLGEPQPHRQNSGQDGVVQDVNAPNVDDSQS